MANDIAISVGLQNQQYMQAMYQSRQAAENYNQTLQKSRASFQHYEKSMNRSTGVMRINQSQMSNLIYMVEDASSVYGTMGLAGAVRAASNNLTMILAPLGTAGMAAGVAATSVTQLYLAFNKNVDVLQKNKDALENYKTKLNEVMEAESRRVQFQQQLRDTDTAKGAFQALMSEKDALENVESQIALNKKLEQQRQKELQDLQARKKELQNQNLGPITGGRGMTPEEMKRNEERRKAAEELAAIEQKIIENKASQTGHEEDLTRLLKEQAELKDRVSKASEHAMEVAKRENNGLQETKRAMLSLKEARQERERLAKREREHEEGIAAATEVAANNKRVIHNGNKNTEDNRRVVEGGQLGSKSFAESMARARRDGFEGPTLTKREQMAEDARRRKQERIDNAPRRRIKEAMERNGSQREQAAAEAVRRKQEKIDNAPRKQDQRESQEIKKAVEAGSKATEVTNQLLNKLITEVQSQTQETAQAPRLQIGGLST